MATGWRYPAIGTGVCPLVQRAHERNPNPAAYFEGALALCAYMRGDYKGASMWIRKTMLPANPGLHLIAAAIFAEAGRPTDAEAERLWLTQNAPDLVKDVRSWVALRAVRSQDIDRFIESLKKAGLPAPEKGSLRDAHPTLGSDRTAAPRPRDEEAD